MDGPESDNSEHRSPTGHGDDVRARVAAINWWHTIDLGSGLVTAGRQGEGTRHTLERLRLPERLEGRTVLDIGAWDGAYSFEAERRGAERVLATDWFAWHSPAAWSDKRGFECAREILQSKVEDRSIDVTDLAPQSVGVFDLVLLSGVLYHVTDPLHCLERAASVTHERLIVETHVTYRAFDRGPRMTLLRPGLLDSDPTNVWAPNARCVVEMLRTVGFRRVEAFEGTPGRSPSIRDRLSQIRRGGRRMVFHAHR